MKELGIDVSSAYCLGCYWTVALPSQYTPSGSWYSQWSPESNIFLWVSGEPIQVTMYANIPAGSPIPSTVDFYMDVLCTGQTIYLGSVSSSTPLGLTQGFSATKGIELTAEGLVQNPSSTYVVALYTFTLGPVYGPVEVYAVANGIKSAPFRAIAYLPTRILVSASPSKVYPGQKVTISGQLQQMVGPNQWAGASGQLVFISDYGWVRTDSNGNFSVTITAPSTPGTYTVKVAFYSTGWLWSSESSTTFTVVQPPTPSTTQPTLTPTPTTQPTTSITTTTPAPSPTPTTIKPKLSAGDLAILLGGAGLLTGITAYGLSKKGKA
jgi:hypothetical protein